MYEVRALGHGAGAGAVAFDDVGHMVAYHAPEPAQLVTLVGQVVAHVGGGGDADLEDGGVAPGRRGRSASHADGPLDDERVADLEDDAVGPPAGELEGTGAVGGHQHREGARRRTQGMVTEASPTWAGRPSARSLMASMARPRVARLAGTPPSTRTAESPGRCRTRCGCRTCR